VLALAAVLSVLPGWPVPAVLLVVRALDHGYWLGLSPVAAVLSYAAAFLWTSYCSRVILSPVRDRRAAGKAARAARAASAPSHQCRSRQLRQPRRGFRGPEIRPPNR